ncbi:GDSL esterase/lipase [Camellia lanceoleosa]|uniref:GDSL esterase/lipase n=1 Tax=Camellia lanceoleosa TaxID=1840588 RepID=A0ACC0GYE1_9ERIC|nr:GDSL esterase/lipase [Camellia lanceoleosa]
MPETTIKIPTIARSDFRSRMVRDYVRGRATGRFSNSRIPTDFISEAFGLRPIVPAYLDPMYNISDFAIELHLLRLEVDMTMQLLMCLWVLFCLHLTNFHSILAHNQCMVFLCFS